MTINLALTHEQTQGLARLGEWLGADLEETLYWCLDRVILPGVEDDSLKEAATGEIDHRIPAHLE